MPCESGFHDFSCKKWRSLFSGSDKENFTWQPLLGYQFHVKLMFPYAVSVSLVMLNIDL